MNLLKKLQIKLLQRDIKKEKSNDYLAKKYPMAMLLSNGVFRRFQNTQLYVPKDSNNLYNINGQSLGMYFKPGRQFISDDYNDKNRYIIISNEAKYKNDETTASFAIYDTNGECVVPHGCYPFAYQTDGYVVLSMPMEKQFYGKPERITSEKDDETYMPSTGKSLKETIGDVKYPRVLIVTNNRIIKTDYTAITPAAETDYFDQPLANNIIWIAQKANNEEVSLKMDKRFYISETYSLPMFSHQDKELIYKDEENGGVYKIEIHNQIPRRINLRTGQMVNLITLKKSNLLKKDRVNETKLEEEVVTASEEEVIL